MPGDTYRHGIVEGVVVDTGSQGEIQHTALKQLQRLRHFLVEILRGFVGAGEVQIIRVQPVRGKNVAVRGWGNGRVFIYTTNPAIPVSYRDPGEGDVSVTASHSRPVTLFPFIFISFSSQQNPLQRTLNRIPTFKVHIPGALTPEIV